jgi:type I restriction enzyme M protein
MYSILLEMSVTTPKSESQLSLSGLGDNSYGDVFKKLYYHLYSNSEVSRAERIVEDISKILLCKLALDRKAVNGIVTAYLRGDGKANEILLPVLASVFPNVIDVNDRFTLGDDAIKRSLAILMPIDLHSAPAHIIGDAFQAIMGPRLRGDKGQFFTPNSLVKALTTIIGIKPGDKVIDPACGTGGFLSEVYRQCGHVKLIGIDKDRDLWRLASALLEISTNGSAKMLNRNSLDIQDLRQLPEELSPFDADVVLTNPPFGAKIGVTDKNILAQFELGYHWGYSKSSNRWMRQNALRRSQDPQILFTELCVRLLRPGGKLGIVLPEGVFGNRTSGDIWAFLQSNGEILALLDCPRTTFQPSTDTKTNVVFFQKSPVERTGKLWVGVAVNCGHNRRGRVTDSAGQPYPDDFAKLGQEFPNRLSCETRWTECAIPTNYYFVPRYYDRRADHELETLLQTYGGAVSSLHEMARRGFIRITKGHEVGSDAYETGNVPFVRTSDITNLEINPNAERGIGEDIYEAYAALQNLEPGDILLVVDGRYRIGRSAILTEHSVKCVVQSHLRIIKVLPKAPINPYELFYILNMQPILNQMRNLVFIQSTLGSLGKRLMELKIIIPEKSQAWLTQVDRFKQIILMRSKLLADLKSISASEVEL